MANKKRMKEGTERSPYEEGKLISVYKSSGGKSWYEIFETHSGYSINGRDLSSSLSNYEDVLERLFWLYLDVPSLRCIEGETFSGDIFYRVKSRSPVSTKTKGIEKYTDEELAENAIYRLHFEASPRGWKEVSREIASL